mmetsp:Transcript_45872/g.111743  ORF Transcript_45872/g.111743 Transcript_45872/m.111743 type:complete len:222 (-) Transcript_45872:263-928(-)
MNVTQPRRVKKSGFSPCPRPPSLMSETVFLGSLIPPPPELIEVKFACPPCMSYQPRSACAWCMSGLSSTIELRVVERLLPLKSETRQFFTAMTGWLASCSSTRSLCWSQRVSLICFDVESTMVTSRLGILFPALEPVLTVISEMGSTAWMMPQTSTMFWGSVCSIWSIVTMLYVTLGARLSATGSKTVSLPKVISYSLFVVVNCLFAGFRFPPFTRYTLLG